METVGRKHSLYCQKIGKWRESRERFKRIYFENYIFLIPGDHLIPADHLIIGLFLIIALLLILPNKIRTKNISVWIYFP